MDRTRKLLVTAVILVVGVLALASSVQVTHSGNVGVAGTVFFYHTQGYSMYPVIHPGDTVLCVDKPWYGKGDVVAFVSPGEGAHGIEKGDFVGHRIVKETDRGFLTSGGWVNKLTGPQTDQVFIQRGDIICEVEAAFKLSGLRLETM